MKRFLPHVVRQAQILTRSDSDLKDFLFKGLAKLSFFKEEKKKLSWVRNEVDQLLKESTQKTNCQKGCHYCCFHPISLSVSEMDDIKSLSIKPDLVRLEKQKAHFKGNEEIEYEDRACVYLVKGSCSIYESRPLICRLTHVASEPIHCHLENETTPIEHLPVTKAALLVGAFYMGNPDVELMPIQL
ncbi:MAG: YkgJ family cysteine cluster protein [Halobacteriovoraceae bacterium]|nr:YkgJ family cysteine cluster protein [Halobacteriovoraceae bacterium]